MDLNIYNHIIDVDVETILKKIQRENTNGYLKHIRKHGENIAITCPSHKGGKENNPSCYVYNSRLSNDVPYGWYRCFTCGDQGPLYKLVSICLSLSIEDAKQWLIDNFSNTYSEKLLSLPKIEISKRIEPNKTVETTKYLDESVLDEFAYFHPYMFRRGLTEEIVLKFRIGYNKKTDSITFPVWDEFGHLIGITERNVKTKYFHIPENMGKPVYLLNYINSNNITEVVVCESQLDALKCWVWGIPAIALFGTGSKKQYDILNKSGIRFYHLALDGDMAGEHGIKRFIKNIRNDVFVDIIQIPNGKDVNDLSKEEFLNLKRINKR